MARKYNVVPVKTYASEENVDKAVDRLYGDVAELTYIIMRTADGRFFPLFIGQSALQHGVHFNFNIAAF